MITQVDFENLLKQTMGLDAVSIGSSGIERAVRQQMSAHGCERMEDYWQQLKDSNDELQCLVEAVVVAETWFFRDRQAFSVLAGVAAAEWRANRRRGSILRLLSLPCSTGEEPYSMAMTLLDEGLTPEEFRVDAVDISAQALARAKHGVYGGNSFRGKELKFRDRYFQLALQGYALSERVRAQVRFRQENILSGNFHIHEESYNVIFCRNLLIYFDPATQLQAMAKLERLLTPGGFLFVGSAEAFLARSSGFTPIDQPMSFAFRKRSAQPRPEPPVKAPVRLPVLPPSRPLAVNHLPLFQRALHRSPTDELQTAFRMADAGCLADSAECCERYLQRHGPASEAYYLLGLVRDAAGNQKDAADCYRKVLYLEPGHVQALMHLALLLETQGDAANASRFRERANRAEASAKQESS